MPALEVDHWRLRCCRRLRSACEEGFRAQAVHDGHVCLLQPHKITGGGLDYRRGIDTLVGSGLHLIAQVRPQHLVNSFDRQEGVTTWRARIAGGRRARRQIAATGSQQEAAQGHRGGGAGAFSPKKKGDVVPDKRIGRQNRQRRLRMVSFRKLCRAALANQAPGGGDKRAHPFRNRCCVSVPSPLGRPGSPIRGSARSAHPNRPILLEQPATGQRGTHGPGDSCSACWRTPDGMGLSHRVSPPCAPAGQRRPGALPPICQGERPCYAPTTG